ncbi:TRAP transporter substrate-binding protein [Sneathiella sp.]|uniref:TRAP transporter substrate-binding protein n=1 Tax=Sneathiella sp. TaxID=1964365 RepID=UPI00260B8E44|nr:TRAP transporter substrate-binding protein [Sneathiella sp.]MDF2368433.1 TRAP transporter substrate-binding protein [Sneathiella sp.]
MKRLLSISMALLLIFSSAAVAKEVKIALAGTEDLQKNGEYVFIKAFADHLNANGMETKVFPSDTLGKEKERFDQVSQGLIQVDMANSAVLFKLAPISKGIFLPFLFSGNDHFDSAMKKGEIIEKINEQIEPHGVRLAGFPMRGGSAGLFNTKISISKFDDVKALRIRGKDGQQIKLFEAWGTKGTVVSWAEVANALQTGVADGYFNPPASALLYGHTAILTHFTPLDSGVSARVALLSEDWYRSLNDKEKSVVDEAVTKGIAANRKWGAEWSKNALSMLKSEGVTVTELEPGERDRFVQASQAIWEDIVTKEDLKTLISAAEYQGN